VWEARDKAVAELTQRLPPDLADRARDDLLDVAVLWTDLRVRLAAAGDTGAPRAALRTLEEAEDLFGPSAALDRERQRHLAALGRDAEAAAAGKRAAARTPRTAWEHYALGRAMLRADDPKAAAGALDQAVRLDPRGFWPNFYQGVCAHRLGRPAEAAEAFRACVTLEPEQAACFYNRAQAYAALDRPAQARADYDRALALDPDLAPAALNRGLLHYQQGRHDAAAIDLKHALAAGADPVLVHYNLALIHLARKDVPAARVSIQRLAQHAPDHPRLKELQERVRSTP
jgi:tetratricopeptide (TPR) repeat protein